MFRSLKKGGIFAASLLGALGVAGSASADVGDFLGNWVNQDSDTSGITHVLISPVGGNQVTVQVFGQCHPTDCDWGTVPGHNYYAAVSSGDVRMITASFNTGFAHKFLVFREAHGGKLVFEALTDFTDGSGRQDYDMTGKLVAMGDLPRVVDTDRLPLEVMVRPQVAAMVRRRLQAVDTARPPDPRRARAWVPRIASA
jgi:hypothetical protein